MKPTAVTIILLLALAFPLLWLIYKTYNVPALAAAPVAVNASATDLPALKNAAKTDPTPDHLINLSMAYINKGMPGKSIDFLKKAIQLDPDGAVAYNDLGVAYTMLQQYQNGIDACSKALQIDTTFQLAKNNLKWAVDEKNKVLETIRQQEQVAESKRDIAFYSAYGFSYFKIGDYNKSIAIWNHIFELDKNNAAALNSIGTAFMMKNQVDDATALFKKVVELEPGNALAKNNLQWALDEKSAVSTR